MLKKECGYCQKKINEKTQTYVLLATINPKNKNESFMHFDCFKKNYEESVNRKARAIITDMQSKAQGLFKSLGGIIGNFQGLRQTGSMLGVNLSDNGMPDLSKVISNNDEEYLDLTKESHKKQNGKTKETKSRKK